VVFGVGLFVAGLTAFYMFRLYFLTFTGAPRDHHRFEHAHESPATMTVPLAILAVPSVLLGFAPFGSYVNRGELGHHGIDLAVAIPATLAGLGGIGLAALLYGRPSGAPARVAASLGWLYRAISRKFYIDEVYLFVTHRIIFPLVCQPLNRFDRRVVDGFMDLTAESTILSGSWLRRTVTGRLQTYLIWVVGGTVVLVLQLWESGGTLNRPLVWAAAAVVAAVYLWQLGLRLLQRSTPLKRIERD